MGRAPAEFWFIQGSDDRLRDLATAGLGPTDIARQLGVTRCSVVYRAARIGVALPTKEQVARAKTKAKPKPKVVYHPPSEPRRFSWQMDKRNEPTTTP